MRINNSKMTASVELLCYYFSYKLINVEMLGMLAKYSKFVLSLSALKRYLKRLGLRKPVPHGYEKICSYFMSNN